MNAWSNYPILRLLIPFIAGILLCNFIEEHLSITPIAVAITTVTGIIGLIVLHRFSYKTARIPDKAISLDSSLSSNPRSPDCSPCTNSGLPDCSPYTNSGLPDTSPSFKSNSHPNSTILSISLHSGILAKFFVAIFFITLISLGYFVTSIRLLQNSPNHFANSGNHDAFIARVVTEPKERTNSYRVVLEVTSVKSQNSLKESDGRVIAYLKKDSLNKADIPCYGDLLIFTKQPSTPDKPGNPGEFNYAAYLKHNSIYHSLYLSGGDYKIIGHNKGNPVIAWTLNIRSRFLSLLRENGLNGKELAVAAAILAGQDDLLDADQRQDYTGAGVIHILCVSGLHAGIIFLMADTILKVFRRNKKMLLISPFIILVIIWLYAAITGLAAPVVRASVMFTFILAGHTFQRQPKSLNNMGAAAFLMLVLDPNLLFNIGFQLSFGAVAGIIIFQQGIRKLWFPKNKLVGYTWDLITVSLAAQIITAPLAIYHFHQFPNFFLFSNLIAIPLSGIVIYTGLFGALASVIPFTGKIIMGILNAEIRLMNSIVNWIESLPMAVTDSIRLPWYAAIILALALICMALWIAGKNKYRLFTSLGCILILLILDLNTEIKTHKQQKIVFHKVNGHPAVSFLEGHLQTLLSDSSLINDIHQADYQLKGFSVLNGVKEQHLKCLQSFPIDHPQYHFTVPEFFSFKGKRLVFLCRGCKLPESNKQVRADYIIICQNAYIKLADINHAFPGATIILDASNSRYASERFKREGELLAMKVYDVKEMGALEVCL